MFSNLKITRMITITIRTWTRLPVLGMLGMTRGPKKPRSHRTNRMTMIVLSIRFLLFRYVLDAVTFDGHARL
jgi:hypothetical protein